MGTKPERCANYRVCICMYERDTSTRRYSCTMVHAMVSLCCIDPETHLIVARRNLTTVLVRPWYNTDHGRTSEEPSRGHSQDLCEALHGKCQIECRA